MTRPIRPSLVTVLKRFAADQSGATSIEYCMIAVLISVVCVGVWQNIGTSMVTMTATVIPGLTR